MVGKLAGRYEGMARHVGAVGGHGNYNQSYPRSNIRSIWARLIRRLVKPRQPERDIT